MDIIGYQTSSIKWCETIYQYSNYVCEFFNTLTGFSYIYFSFLLYKNLQIIHKKKLSFSNIKNMSIIEFNNYNIYLTTLLIGIFTVYFHGTLSLLGQLLDEFSILALLLLFDINHMKYLTLKIIIGFFLFVKFSFFNRFMLFGYGFFRSRYLFYDYYYNTNLKLKNLFIYGSCIFFLGTFVWILDLFYCERLYISLHWLWHILSSYSLYLLSNYIFFTRQNIDYEFNNLEVIPRIN
tara:strand:- start:1253 stop:1960 length:708 start_codon:yes stop_codon:yes gene_type:complete